MDKLRSWKTLCLAYFSATAMIFAHAQTTTHLCFSSGTLPAGELGRLWPVMKAALFLSSRQGTNLSGSRSDQIMPEDQVSVEEDLDLQSCVSTLANVTVLEVNLLRFVVSKTMVDSLDALRQTVENNLESGENVEFCRNQVGDLNQSICWQDADCCNGRRRTTHAQQRELQTTARSLQDIITRLTKLQRWISSKEGLLVYDAVGSGSGSGFADSTLDSLHTSPFSSKLSKIDSLLDEAERVVLNISATSCWTNVSLWKRNESCQFAAYRIEAKNRELLLEGRRTAALVHVSSTRVNVHTACRIHRVTLGLKEVVRRVHNIESWWCKGAAFARCFTADLQGTPNHIRSGLQAMLCSVMLAQSRGTLICQGTDVSCCSHLRSLQKLQNLQHDGSFSNDTIATCLVQELKRSCNNVTASSTPNSTEVISLQRYGADFSVCSRQMIHVSLLCPFPFVNSSIKKHWNSDGRSQFKSLLQNVLRKIYELKVTPSLENNRPAIVFPCAKSCRAQAQGFPTEIYRSLRYLDMVVHYVWLCVFLRSLYILYINWYKMTGSQPHRSLLLCNFCYAFLTIVRLGFSHALGVEAATCRDDGSLREGYWEEEPSVPTYLCAVSGLITLFALVMIAVGLFWANLIWYLIVQDIIECRRTEVVLHAGKPFFRRLKDDKRFRLEALFFLLCVCATPLIVQLVIESAKTVVSHPLLNLCMADNSSQAITAILVVLYLPAGALFISSHKRIENVFQTSAFGRGSLARLMGQSMEKLRWYGWRLRLYGISTLVFSSLSIVLLASGLIEQNATRDRSYRLQHLNSFLRCHLVRSPTQDCPQFYWPGLVSQYAFYCVGQILCVYNIMLLSWCWQRNLRQPANSVLTMIKDKGSRTQSSW